MSAIYTVYLLRCANNALYTGITTDLSRRFSEHRAQNTRGAKFTHGFAATSIAAAWQASDRSSALRLEYQIKQLRKAQKERLITENDFTPLLAHGIEAAQYRRMQI